MTRIATLSLILSLGGCAPGAQTYPSLAPRAVERQGFEEPATVTAVAAPDPSLDARIARSAGALAAVVTGFDRDAQIAQRAAAAARGQSAGREPWIEAQTTLATLDDWRAQGSALATDVESLSIARAATLAVPYPALDALAARIAAETKRITAIITQLQAQLAPA